jgi:phage baseplate assembly protein W
MGVVWRLKMTTVVVPSPTAVNPVPLISSNGTEIKVPFQIDVCTGGVASISNDLEIIAQHVLSLILTMHNERLMLPAYGGNVPARVFDLNSSVAAAAVLQNDLVAALQTWEPSIQNPTVQVSPSNVMPQVMNVEVTYIYGPFGDINTVSCSVGGGVIEVISL